jgi:hypothetical protein
MWSLTLRQGHRLGAFKNRVVRRIFGLEREEIIGGWKKLHNEALLYFYQVLLSDQIKEVQMGRASSMNGGNEKCIQNVSQKTRKEETTCEAKA